MDTNPFCFQLQGSKILSRESCAAVSQKLRDGYIGSLTRFSLQEGEVLRIFKLFLSRVIVIRSWVSLIRWIDFLHAGAVYVFLRVRDTTEPSRAASHHGV